MHIALENIDDYKEPKKYIYYTSSSNEFQECVDDVSPNKWILRGCDGPPDDKKCKNPAVSLSIDLSTSTSTTTSPSHTPTPTAIPGTCVYI